jgi:hypothetical protein
MLRVLAIVSALIMALSVAPASAMDFKLLQSAKGQRLVLASGAIEPGDAQMLATALNRATRSRNGTKQLLLDSPGGSVAESLAMADVMDHVRVSTVVPNGAMCASACASIVFVSGKYRTIEKGGALVIHSCFDARNGRKVDFCDALISQHAEFEGVPGAAMMALQEAAGTDAAFVMGGPGAACFGLTRAPGTAAHRSAPCLETAVQRGRRR